MSTSTYTRGGKKSVGGFPLTILGDKGDKGGKCEGESRLGTCKHARHFSPSREAGEAELLTEYLCPSQNKLTDP